jgi:hypothetical protein
MPAWTRSRAREHRGRGLFAHVSPPTDPTRLAALTSARCRDRARRSTGGRSRLSPGLVEERIQPDTRPLAIVEQAQ